jgi:hypothetical protein
MIAGHQKGGASLLLPYHHGSWFCAMTKHAKRMSHHITAAAHH